MKVLDAIRITVSIPILQCISLYDKIYVDGGILDNYPTFI